MPTYEFDCPAGHRFEKFYRKMSDFSSLVPCPSCGKPATRRMSVGGGLIFKGSGFYITDYGKDGKKDQTKPAGDVSKSDAKPETKTEGQAESKSDQAGKEPAEAKPVEKKASESKAAGGKPPLPGKGPKSSE
ncbi:MAG: FmdB family zinc ribbon protein [Gemmatimonadaceae bacterium]